MIAKLLVLIAVVLLLSSRMGGADVLCGSSIVVNGNTWGNDGYYYGGTGGYGLMVNGDAFGCSGASISFDISWTGYGENIFCKVGASWTRISRSEVTSLNLGACGSYPAPSPSPSPTPTPTPICTTCDVVDGQQQTNTFIVLLIGIMFVSLVVQNVKP
jgi:hypothetical protein